MLYDSQGGKITDVKDIAEEIQNFYKALLGSAANSLPSPDIPILRSGPRLSPAAGHILIAPVTTLEIDAALHSIDDSKAPGLDGFNAVFFKKAWHVIREDVYKAIFYLFSTGEMYIGINCTSVTLVPKIHNSSQVKDFRPIACCSLVYKLISKILTARMQRVITEVVSDCQSGFIPRRCIDDNILLATELIKGYGRAHISPRCVLKIDLKKAYDSVE